MKFLKWSSTSNPSRCRCGAQGGLFCYCVSKGCSMVQDDPDNPDAPIPGGTGPAFGD